MSASVELSVILRDGTKKSFSKPAGQGDPSVDIKSLQKSLLSLQQESNSYLTELVEQEKNLSQTSENGNKIIHSNKNDDDSDSEEDSEEDEEEKDEEPVKKKKKR